MRKFLFFLVMICLLITLAGCENSSSLANTDTENNSTNNINATNNFISVTLEITELESGFSAVRYDGDYGMNLFLEQGGADSDQTVLRIRKQYV